MFRIANRKLGGVNSNSNPTRPGGKIVAGQRPLPALVELALGVEGKRVRGNDETRTELITQRHQNLPSRV